MITLPDVCQDEWMQALPSSPSPDMSPVPESQVDLSEWLLPLSAVTALRVLGRCSWLRALCRCLVTSPCSVTAVLLTRHSRGQRREQRSTLVTPATALFTLFWSLQGFTVEQPQACFCTWLEVVFATLPFPPAPSKHSAWLWRGGLCRHGLFIFQGYLRPCLTEFGLGSLTGSRYRKRFQRMDD